LLASADQLRQAYRGLDTEFIRDRIASEELSEMTLQIAREELLQRQVDEPDVPHSGPVTHNAEAYMLAVHRDFMFERVRSTRSHRLLGPGKARLGRSTESRPNPWLKLSINRRTSSLER
jgi:hypothetical protein